MLQAQEANGFGAHQQKQACSGTEQKPSSGAGPFLVLRQAINLPTAGTVPGCPDAGSWEAELALAGDDSALGVGAESAEEVQQAFEGVLGQMQQRHNQSLAQMQSACSQQLAALQVCPRAHASRHHPFLQ